MGRFDDKVVMIAGAARGIGFATAAAFGREGATLALSDVDTEMHRAARRGEAESRGMSFEELKQIEWDKIPLKHACPPEDIANAITFLASEESKYITEASLDVNGGVMFR